MKLKAHLTLSLGEHVFGDAPDPTPADHMARQVWQEAVEELILEIRAQYRQPAFGLPEAEISVHYHLPLSRFVALVEQRLGK